MAVSTVSVEVSPDIGWVQIADNPNWIHIRAQDSRQWHLTVTASGAPAADADYLTFVPTYQSDGFRFESDVAIAGEVYVRTPVTGAQGQKMVISAIKDETV